MLRDAFICFGARHPGHCSRPDWIIVDPVHASLDIWIKGKDALFQVPLAFKAEPPAHIR